jgi:CRP-like cAMP-binding protein
MNRNGQQTADRAADRTHEPLSRSDIDVSGRPRYASGAREDLLTGGRILRRAFLKTPLRYAPKDATLIRAGEREPAVILLRSGFAFRFCVLDDGRRAILDLLTPGDAAGLDYLVLANPVAEITAASRVGYHALDPADFRALLVDRCVATSVLALIAEARWRSERLSVMIGRLDAQARIAALILGIHDRLRRRGLTDGVSFNLPLTQEQIADHLGLTVVHVNRTLRRLREGRLVLVDRQVVMILDLEGLRELARGLPQTAETLEPLIPLDRLP